MNANAPVAEPSAVHRAALALHALSAPDRAWVLQAPGVTAPIVGATKTHHLKQVFAAVDIKLSAEEVAMMEEPYRPHPIVGYEQPNPRKMVR